MEKRKPVEVYKDGKILRRYDSMIDAIYDLHVSYASIRKSIRFGSYIRGYQFRTPHMA